MENELGILDEYGCHAKNCLFSNQYLLFKKSALIGIIADNLEKWLVAFNFHYNIDSETQIRCICVIQFCNNYIDLSTVSTQHIGKVDFWKTEKPHASKLEESSLELSEHERLSSRPILFSILSLLFCNGSSKIFVQ